MESFASLSQFDFQSDTFVYLKAIPESAKVCRIFTRFSVKAVMNVAHHVLSLPTGLTESQRNQRIADCAGLPCIPAIRCTHVNGTVCRIKRALNRTGDPLYTRQRETVCRIRSDNH